MKLKQCADTSSDWRACQLYQYSTVFELWMDKQQTITVKPSVSARRLERDLANDLAISSGHIMLTCPLTE